MKIHELLSDESKWTQGAFARDDRGNQVHVADEEACCWCLMGAALKCYPGKDANNEVVIKMWEHVKELIKKDIEVSFISDRIISYYNDAASRKFSEVKQIAVTLDV